ncbi:MAG: hypothetical protein C5B43_02490 [Verrucomicrobia bacterium]|nr:MAG: hypothetical protein C5B43_02490 [Verrucomicrobiota bacterium]
MLLEEINWNSFINELSCWPCFWPFVIAFIALLILWKVIRKKRQTIYLFKNETGKITVLQSALIDLIKKACEDLAPDSKPTVYIYPKNDKLNLKIKIKIYPEQQIEQLTTAIQQKVKSMLHDSLAIQNIGSINILITSFYKENPTDTQISSE